MNDPLEDIDEGIKLFVKVLAAAGVETYESCEGGPGHAFPEPTIRFHGPPGAGLTAAGVALQHDLPISALRRVWRFTDHELSGPTWEMTFWKKATG